MKRNLCIPLYSGWYGGFIFYLYASATESVACQGWLVQGG